MKKYFFIIVLFFLLNKISNSQNIITVSENISAYSIKMVVKENVIGFFGLQKKYDTDLKKKVFMDTEEYRKLLDSIRILKENYLVSQFRVYFTSELKSYNLKTKSFELVLGVTENNLPQYYERSLKEFMEKLYIVKDFCFGTLNIKVGNDWFGKKKYITLECTEDEAINLENSNIGVEFIFDIDGKTCTVEEDELLFFDKKDYLKAKNIQINIYKNKEIVLSYHQ